MSDSEEELEEEQAAEEPCLACMGKHRAHTCGERGAKFMKQNKRPREERRRRPPKRPPSPDPASPASSTGKKKATAQREEARQRSAKELGRPRLPGRKPGWRK